MVRHKLYALGVVIVLLGLGSGALRAEEASPSPMLGSRDAVWGRVGLSYRARPELRYNSDLDAAETDTLVFGLQRARLALSLNYQEMVEAFVQLQDARRAGFGNSSVAYTGNTDLHQAWAQINIDTLDLSVRLGRQQLVYGDQRLIGHLEWANQGRVFEAAKVRWSHGLGWLDGFAAVFTPWPNGSLTDASHLFGFYDSLTFLDGALVWEQYLLGLVDSGDAMPPGTTFDAALEAQPASPGRQLLTVGTRARYRGFGVDSGIEGAYQLGYADVGERITQNAFALHADARYTFAVALKPYVGVEGNYGSGDAASTGRTSEKFQNLFPTNHAHYGAMDLQSWSNAADGSVFGGFALWSKVKFNFAYWLHGRASPDDAWYNAGGMALAAPDPGNPTEVDDDLVLGHEVNGTAVWVINDHVKLVDGIGVFIPDGYARVVGTDPQLWAFSMLIVSL